MPIVEYDQAVVDQVATTLDLRRPNREALDAIARALDTADESAVGPVEIVADLATGVGKTFIAGGLLDYLWEQGVRNVVIVTPGSTIQKKTVNNLTPGNPKYLRGLQSNPLVVTLDDFERGSVGSALDDPDRFKVFVFTVQSLLRPNTKDNRRAHRPHETLGQSLSDYLRAADDLVVIADEHHVYFNRSADQFRRAINDLAPSALIGLTATPHESTDPGSIVYLYPLADAIADGYVKIPVLVARRDKKSEPRTQMADGVALLEAKAAAMTAYTKATGQQFRQPIMFVVAQTIDEANELSTMLAGPDYLDGADKVLVVTSEEPDETLRLLDTLEEPGSPIRAVVSVSMLKEGWDVANIYVIAAVRALESSLLTEQILGRGLRLPFGQRTGVGMLDTVEVLSHHAFADLLKEAKVLLAQTLGARADEATATVTSLEGVQGTPVNLTDTSSGQAASTTPATPDDGPSGATSGSGGDQEPEGDGEVPGEAAVPDSWEVTVSVPGPLPADVNSNQGTLFDGENDDGNSLDGADTGSHQVGGIATVDARLNNAAATTETLSTPIKPREPGGTRLPLFVPQVTWAWARPPFSLTGINTTDVEALGRAFANDNAPSLRRKKIDAQRGEDGVSVVIGDIVDETVAAATLPIQFNSIETDLVRRILRSNAVGQTVTEANAATAIAKAFLAGAGVTEATPWRVEHGRLATEALANWISAQQTAVPAVRTPQVTQTRWPEPPERTEAQPPASRHLINSSRDFVRNYPYDGWANASTTSSLSTRTAPNSDSPNYSKQPPRCGRGFASPPPSPSPSLTPSAPLNAPTAPTSSSSTTTAPRGSSKRRQTAK